MACLLAKLPVLLLSLQVGGVRMATIITVHGAGAQPRRRRSLVAEGQLV